MLLYLVRYRIGCSLQKTCHWARRGVNPPPYNVMESLYKVSIDEFIDSDKYLNLKDNVWPEIRKLLRLAARSQVRVIDLIIGKGIGKSFSVGLFKAYSSYSIASHQDPCSLLNLAPSTPIYSVNVSLSELQARSVLFSEFKARLRSPCFEPFIVRNVTREVEFTNNFKALSANCFSWHTPILLNEKAVHIGKVVTDKIVGEVEGVDLETGVVGKSKVSGHFINGKTKDWVRIGWGKTRKKWGGGALVTNDQVFLKNGVYVKAKDLEVGDKLDRIDWELGEVEKQILYGTLLGDSCVFPARSMRGLAGSATEAYIEFCQGEAQKKYLDWKTSYFSPFLIKPYLDKRWNVWHYCTKEDEIFSPFLQMSYKDRIERLSRLGWAVWYMDDGTIRGGKDVSISMNKLEREGAEFAKEVLYRKYRIRAEVGIYPYKDGSNNHPRVQLRFRREEGKRFLDLIGEFLMFKGIDVKFNSPEGTLKRILYKNTVPVIRKQFVVGKWANQAFDIKAGSSHNFTLPGGIVVHNSGDQTWLGFNFLEAEADEVEFLQRGMSRQKIAELLGSVLGSLESRPYYDHTKFFRLSSVNTDKGFLYQRYDEMKEKSLNISESAGFASPEVEVYWDAEKHELLIFGPSWAFNPHQSKARMLSQSSNPNAKRDYGNNPDLEEGPLEVDLSKIPDLLSRRTCGELDFPVSSSVDYFVHCDLAKKGRLGLACSHMREALPYVDGMFCVTQQEDVVEVDMGSMNLLLSYLEGCGVKRDFVHISFDSWQSFKYIQDLRALGYVDVDVFSPDEHQTVFKRFFNLLESKSADVPYYEPLVWELQRVSYKKGRVWAPRKDVLDAVSASIFRSLEFAEGLLYPKSFLDNVQFASSGFVSRGVGIDFPKDLRGNFSISMYVNLDGRVFACLWKRMSEVWILCWRWEGMLTDIAAIMYYLGRLNISHVYTNYTELFLKLPLSFVSFRKDLIVTFNGLLASNKIILLKDESLYRLLSSVKRNKVADFPDALKSLLLPFSQTQLVASTPRPAIQHTFIQKQRAFGNVGTDHGMNLGAIQRMG